MSSASVLDTPFSLGQGRTICPPAGWLVDGYISGDDSLRLRPASQVRWFPQGEARLSIHWNKCMSPLSPISARVLASLLRRPLGIVSIEELKSLFPELIRVPIVRLTRAQIACLPRSQPSLEIEYFIAEHGEAGLVYYMPGQSVESGEYQILSYEGQEPAFTAHLAVARKSLRTFCDSGDFSVPGRSTGLVQRKGLNDKQTIPRKKTASIRASLPGGLLYEYKLLPGETVKTLVRKKWPGLSEDEARAKVKEIYALNRARGNAIFAWSLKEGSVVLLPV